MFSDGSGTVHTPNGPALPLIEAQGVSRIYTTVSGETVHALGKVDLRIADGEFVCLVGPSGCGKSTFLRLLAGLDPCDGGRLTLAGHPVLGPSSDVGVVFQTANLLPWFTVLANVSLPLRVGAGRGRPAPTHQVQDLLAIAGIAEFANKYPYELSGGMQQRAAIVRALVRDPKVLLMDEPFGALDAQTRHFMQESLLQILEKERKTVVFVTHGVEEAAFLSTRVVIMASRPGRIREVIPIDLPYPRDAATKTSPEFIKIRAVIEKVVREEFQKLRAAEGV